MSDDHAVAKAESAAKLSRANAKLDRCRDRGNVRLSDLEMVRNDLAELVDEHSAALDELERLRAERADQVRLARSAYSAGWTVHAALAANAVQRMGVDLREQSARDYADEIFPAQAASRPDATPQRPERGADTDGAE